jgi:hypothetical protein
MKTMPTQPIEKSVADSYACHDEEMDEYHIRRLTERIESET